MGERRRAFRTVATDPNLRRVELAFLGFNMTEFATWIAILVYAFDPRRPARARTRAVPAGRHRASAEPRGADEVAQARSR